MSKPVLIIPARGGSKRIPRKNIRLFCGKPMIAWPIAAGMESGLFDQVVVTTDDKEIAETARSLGAEVPFVRPKELSDDHTPIQPVVAHAIDWLEANRGPVGAVCCLFATTPFVRPEFLQRGLEILKEHADAEFVFTVTSSNHSIFRSLKIAGDGSLSMLWPEHEKSRSQDLPAAWHDAGQFYWGWKKSFQDCKGILSARAYPLILPRDVSHDIDTAEDWKVAELLFQALRERTQNP